MTVEAVATAEAIAPERIIEQPREEPGDGGRWDGVIEHLLAGLKALWSLSETAVRVLLVASVLTNSYYAFSLSRRMTELELERARWNEQRKLEVDLLGDVRKDVRQAVDTIITLSARVREDNKR